MDYPDFAVWQRDRLRGEELARQLAYWREVLAGVPECPPLVTPTHEVARTNATVPPGLAPDAAASLARYAVALSRHLQRNDLVIGIQVTGRTRIELAPVAGPLADVVPLRVSLADDPTFAELCDRVRSGLATAVAGELPFDLLWPGAVPPLFAHEPLAGPVLDLPGVAARGEVLVTGTAAAGLTLFADTSTDKAELVLEYRTDVLDAPAANRFLRSVAAS
jgi:hypothetical protein